MTEETYPSGRVVKTTINSDGELAQVQSRKNTSVGFFTYADGFRYNASGAVTKMQLGNGHWETASYNERQQVTQIGLGTVDDEQDLLKLEFGYTVGGPTPANTPDRNNGSMRSQKITVPAVGSTPGFTAVQEYAYDGLNRLTSATEHPDGSSTTTWKQEFSYDRYGNKNFVTGTGHTTTLGSCSTGVCNPTISTSTNRISTSGYTYDADGNLTADLQENSKHQKFWYDAEGRQVAFFSKTNTSTTNPTLRYAFDGEGKRIKKYLGNSGTTFVYDAGGKLVGEYEASTTDDEVEGYVPKVSYMTNDHLGSPRIVTDQNGSVVSRKDFAAFGDETVSTQRTTTLGYTTPDIRQDYTGYQKDEESSLEYAQARYYNPQHGRFTSADPLPSSASIRNPQSFNRYSYVLNSPYKFTDPLGLMAMGGSGRGRYVHIQYVNDFSVPSSDEVRPQINTNTNTTTSAPTSSGDNGSQPQAAEPTPPPHSDPSSSPHNTDDSHNNAPATAADLSTPQTDKNAPKFDTKTRAELRDYLVRSPIGGLIINIEFGFDDNGKDVATAIKVTSVKDAVDALIAAKDQIQNSGTGSQHVNELGEKSSKDVYDFRSYTEGSNRLGKKSLQIDIGKTTNRIRADLDPSNPTQDVVGGAVHVTPIVVNRIVKVFKKIF